MQVSFSTDQYKLVQSLLQKHYDQVTTDWNVSDYDQKATNAYRALIALRVPLAEEAWKEYTQNHPDPEWRFYDTKEEFFKDQYTIYPEDLVTV
jgi:hypothetical protein